MPHGRPRKYASAEEARLKRIEKTKESNERMKLKKQQQGKGILGDLSNTITSGVNNMVNKVTDGVSNVQDKASTYVNKVINPGQAYPPCLMEINNEMGDEKITGLTLRRNPVSSLITGAMNAVSFGSFSKNMSRLPFDKLYHLSLLIKTAKCNLVFEKVERVNITKTISSPLGLDTLEISNIPSLID